MSTLDFTIFDLDFPAGSKNKTATLVAGEREALLVDAAFTRADGHRLAAAVLDSGRTLTTVFVSHGDPDFYFGAEVLADAFPEATFVATPAVIEHIQHSYAGKLKAWAASARTCPPAWSSSTRSPATSPRGPPVRARGGPADLPDRHYLWQAESVPSWAACWSSPGSTSGPPTPPSPSARRLARPAGRDGGARPELVVPGHRLPGAPATPAPSPPPATTCSPSRRSSHKAADGAALTEAWSSATPATGC